MSIERTTSNLLQLKKVVMKENMVSIYREPHKDFERKLCKSCEYVTTCINNKQIKSPKTRACPEYKHK